ncbi:MAG: tRNA lysidine(34) synthetase TilS [Lentisphaeria bacterium]|nr:tRNA lysidine(34) synthetase TilS [Lentisphaeria bacterium]NQZ67705.1 tRNA lysidine(34) synthetase TilS [Lentisphaeria bacterium]
MENIIDKVNDFIREKLLLQGIQNLFVGFSGGADSSAALLLMKDQAIPVEAVHINHGLRGDESDADERWCADFCEKNQIPFQAIHVDVKGDAFAGESIEMAARRLRLIEWQKLYTPNSAVVLGHHLDDLIETFFIRLMRGCNSGGLSALKECVDIKGVRFVRPLLVLRKQEILTFLQENGVDDFCEDSTNSDDGILRNHIRHNILPLFESKDPQLSGILKSLQFIAEDAEFIDSQIDLPESENLSLEKLQTLDGPILNRYLNKWLHYKNPEFSFSHQAQSRLKDALKQGGYQLIDLNKTHFLELDKGQLSLIEKNSEEAGFSYSWNWQEEPELDIPEIGMTLYLSDTKDGEQFDADKLAGQLTVRSRKEGDSMIPFSKTHEKKIKKILSDSALLKSEKKHLAYICNNDTLIWVPHLKRAEFARVTESTKRVITIDIKSMKEY